MLITSRIALKSGAPTKTIAIANATAMPATNIESIPLTKTLRRSIERLSRTK